MSEVPVLGKLREQHPHRCLTSFFHFKTTVGVQGLARVNGHHLEILAVHSSHPGRGDFRNFIANCKRSYASIRFWALLNPELAKTLTRYGFYGGFDTDEFGEMVDVMDWNKL